MINFIARWAVILGGTRKGCEQDAFMGNEPLNRSYVPSYIRQIDGSI